MNKKVLVTGATGFVGAYILRFLLQKGYKIKALRRKNSPMALVADIQSQIEWIDGDVLDLPFLEMAMKEVQQVYHSAAMISFNPQDVNLMFKINAEGTANVVNAALYAGIEKFIHISSIAALGRKAFQTHVNEEIQWENSKENSNYAISKFKAECEVWRGFEEGLNGVVVNPSVILGAGYWNQGSCKLFQEIWRRNTRFYPSGTTGFVDVRDVAKAAIALMESDISNERYILNGENWSYQQFFTQTAKALGKREPSIKIQDWQLNIAYRLDWLRSKLFNSNPLLTQETARTVQSTFYYSNEKIKKDLSFEFTPIERCIQETAKVFLESKDRGVGCLMC